MLLLFIAKHKPSIPAESGEVPHVQGILETSPQQHALKPKATTGDTMHYTSQIAKSNYSSTEGFFEGGRDYT